MASKKDPRAFKKELVSREVVPKVLSKQLEAIAQHLVDPGHSESLVYPSQTPGLAGSVTYPLIVEVTGLSDFLVRVKPSLYDPLLITSRFGIASSATPVAYTSRWKYDAGGASVLGTFGEYYVGGQYTGGKLAIPLRPTTNCDVLFYIAISQAEYVKAGSLVVESASLVGGIPTWTKILTTDEYFTDGRVLTTPLYTLATTVIALRASYVTSVSGTETLLPCTLDLVVYKSSMLQSWTPSALPIANLFQAYAPDWKSLIGSAERVSIPACDALVTYQGSTLENQGAIIACNLQEDLGLVGDWYSTLSVRKYDKYEGRLASEGQTEGGAHWHCLHDSLDAYALHDGNERFPVPKGYIAVKGMNANQVVRVHVNITINYRTQDPSFSMRLQPYWGEFSMLLYMMRADVPVVSSNDAHVKKLLRLLRSAAGKAAKYAMDNPDKVAAALGAIASGFA